MAALVGPRNAPDGSQPKIDHWYQRLAKPPFTPPDPVFGAVWPVVEIALALGGHRFLCQPSIPVRNGYGESSKLSRSKGNWCDQSRLNPLGHGVASSCCTSP